MIESETQSLVTRNVTQAINFLTGFLYLLIYVYLPQLTFGSQHVIYDWLVVLDVMVTDQSGEVMQNFSDTGLDDAITGVGRELLNVMLCVKKAGRLASVLHFRW